MFPMTPFKAYTEFMALRAHFNMKYDYVKYRGEMKWITEASYQKRKDKYFFERLAKRKDYKDFLVANFIHNPKAWVVTLGKPEAEDTYTEWKRKMQSLAYIFRTELKKLPDSLFNTLKCEIGSTRPPPVLLQSFLSSDISLETFCILLDLTGIKKFWDKKLTVPEWEGVSLKVEKYTPFISYDKPKMEEIADAHFTDAILFIPRET